MQTLPPPNPSARRAGALGEGFAEDLLQGMLAAVLPADAPPNETPDCRIAAAVGAFEALRPRNHAEAMLAAQAIVCHYASMDLFRRANQPGVNDDASMKLRKSAVSTMRAMTAATRALERLQANPLPEAEDAAPAPAAPAATRATSGAIEVVRSPPKAPRPDNSGVEDRMGNDGLLHAPRSDEEFSRKRIDRVNAVLAKRHGSESVKLPGLTEGFAGDTIAAALGVRMYAL